MNESLTKCASEFLRSNVARFEEHWILWGLYAFLGVMVAGCENTKENMPIVEGKSVAREAATLMQHEDFEGALRLYDRAVFESEAAGVSVGWGLYASRGLAKLRLSQFEGAALDTRMAAKAAEREGAEPDDIMSVTIQLGMIALASGKIDEGIEFFTTAIEMKNEYTLKDKLLMKVYEERSRALELKGDQDGAVRDRTEANKLRRSLNAEEQKKIRQE